MASIEKIYSIKLEGEKEVIQSMNEVNRSFDRARDGFVKLQAVQSKNLIVDPSELEKERQALLEAEKALLKETAAKVKARAEAEALAAARQKEQNEAAKSEKANERASSSYAEVTAKMNELKRGTTEFQQAQMKVSQALRQADGEWRKETASIEENAAYLNANKERLREIQARLRELNKGIDTFKMWSKDTTNANEKLNELRATVTELTTEETLLKTEISQIGIHMRAQAKEIQAAEGSMDEANQTLGMMRTLWRSLSDEQKDSAFGQTLLQQINDLDLALKGADAEIGNHFRKVGNYTQGVVQALKDAGMAELIEAQIESSKNKVAELDKHFEDLKKQLEAVKKAGEGGFGGLETQLIQNRTEANKLREEVSRIEKELQGVGNVGNEVTNSMGNNFKSLQGHLTKLALGIVGLQAVMSRVQSGISKGIESAKQIVVVEQAFDRLNDPNLLANLREATNNTISDLTLMRQAVKAENLGIPIRDLGTYLGFAARRAEETGENVDTVVNSIVDGIGRKGNRVFTRMGITLEDVNKELGGISKGEATVGQFAEAITKVIEKENAKAGESIDTVKAKLDQNTAAWENLQTEIGEKALPILAETGAILFSIVSFILAIPFPFWIAGMTAIAAIYASANAQIILQRLELLKTTIAQNAATTSTNLLSASQMILSNSLKIVTQGFRTLFTVIKAHPLTALVVILAAVALWIGKVASKNEQTRRSFERMGLVIEKISDIFMSLFGAFSKIFPIMEKWIDQLIVPLINRYAPVLILQLQTLAGVVNVLASEFLYALKSGMNFAKGFGDIWDAIKNKDTAKLKNTIKEMGGIIADGFTGVGERAAVNFWEGFLLTEADIPMDDGGSKKNDDSGGKKPAGKTKDDRLKQIDDERNRLLAIQKQYRLKDEIDEETYQKNILKINNDAINQKLAIIKGANASERRMIEELKAEKLQNEINTNDEIFNLRKKALDNLLEIEKENAQDELDKVANSPNSSNVQKEQAEQDYYTRMLQIQIAYNEQVDVLELELNQKSEENARERARIINKINQDLTRNAYELTQAMFDDAISLIERAKTSAQNTADIYAETQRIKILKDENLNQKQKEIALDRIYIENRLASIAAEIEAEKKAILIYVQKLGIMAMMNEEVQKSLKLIYQLEADTQELINTLNKLGKQQINAPSTSNTIQLATDGILDAFSLDEDDYGSLIGHALTETFDLAAQAMNNYFDAERQRVEESKKLAYERIELEKEQLLNQAQSQAERETIEKQAEEKKKQAEKAAGERLKKIKKQEAKIAFATELANIWATAYQLGPIAGPIMGSILSGIAAARFAMTMSNINKTKFAKGGIFSRGGMLDGPSHSQNNGMPVVNPNTGEVQAYMEGGESIINKRAMADNKVYSVSGTPGQIASKINSIGGGVDFLGGATMKRFAKGGMYLGSQVQPPVFSSYYDKANEARNSERLEAVEGLLQSTNESLNATNETLNREVNRKTVVSSREMSDSQREYDKQTEISSL